MTRSILALGATAAIVVAAVLALSPRVVKPNVGELPTTPDAWSRVSIDSPWATAQVDALVAGPRGLLAFLGKSSSSAMQLSVSRDGRTWTLVPNEQFPSDAVLLPPPGGLRLPAVGTTHGFLFVADGNDVWASEDGYTWQRLTDRARDEDLRAGSVLAVAVGGPGLIAVGSDNKAWYSEDGSDWTQAEVPAPPTASFEAQGLPPPAVSMQGVAVRGETFVAWGTARSSSNSEEGMQQTVLWTSGDGRSWANVPDQHDLEPLRTVAAGPGGFVATDMNVIGDARAIRFSADGRSWETVDVFESRLPSYDEGLVSSVAAASSGYVAVGGDGKCAKEPCPDAVATIWTSPDGRSWSRLPSDDRFEVADAQRPANHSGAWATSAVAWDSSSSSPAHTTEARWSGSPALGDATATPIVNPTPSPSTDPRTPFLGVWVSTSDGDGGTQRMTVDRSANDSLEIVVTDTIATVCAGTSSTMTGIGSVEGGRLVIPAPDYRCDDGTEPQPMGGPGLNEELRNLTYTRVADSDTLSVGIGDVWLHEGVEAPSPAPHPSEQVAPPSEPVAPTATAQPSVDPGSLGPITDRIVCGNHNGTWSFPKASPDPATTVQLPPRYSGGRSTAPDSSKRATRTCSSCTPTVRRRR